MGPESLSIADYTLTDDLADPSKWTAPAVTLGPNELITVVAQGVAVESRDIYLFSPPANGGQMLEHISFPSLEHDQGWARLEDGWVHWGVLPSTPGQSNGLHRAPRVWAARHTPRYPAVDDTIVVTVSVVDADDNLESVIVAGDVDGEPFSIAMHDDGRHLDGAPADGRFGAEIGPFPSATEVHYFIQAVDAESLQTFAPLDAPQEHYTISMGAHPLTLNELMAANDTTIADSAGEYDDWLELHNADPQHTLQLGGMFLSDRRDDPTKWRFPYGTTIAPGQVVLVWCDEDAWQEGLHTNFKLRAAGEFLVLMDNDGVTVLDSLSFGQQQNDIALARVPDGDGHWFSSDPTPGALNVPDGNGERRDADQPPGLVVGPNPFDAGVTIKARWRGDRAQLRIYDARGALVRTLLQSRDSMRGGAIVVWDGITDLGLDAASGSYICRLETDTEIYTTRVVRVK